MSLSNITNFKYIDCHGNKLYYAVETKLKHVIIEKQRQAYKRFVKITITYLFLNLPFGIQ